ncbi:MAG TPA: rhodanese-like domain-containing protein [Acidimicrobiia bacterium]|jgi:rhodanese-related sulfurtransferase|nr:rhodanese-like domain-containing protein [Acidimicrobiia bacterium]
MATSIGRTRLDELMANGAQLVEVLPAAEYEAEHLPQARSLPLRSLAERAVEELERDRPVIVYCQDSL